MLEKEEFYTKKNYSDLEKFVKEDLQNLNKNECIKKLHEALGDIHRGLTLKDLNRIWYFYEKAQFIMENYYLKKE